MKIMKVAASMAILGMVAVAGVQAADTDKVDLHLTMLTVVNVQGLALWDITNSALADDGTVDAKKLTAANWTKLLEIGRALEDGGRKLGTSNGIVAAAPGAKLQDEGNPGASTAADVQRYVDAKPAVFRTHALELQKTGAGIAEAARKHDGKGLSELSNSLDGVCESCHKVFWYPQQSK